MPIRLIGRSELIGRRATARITAGSTSVRAFEQPLREAAATARAMLIARRRRALGRRRRANATPPTASSSTKASGFSFGELAEEAAATGARRASRRCERASGRLVGPAAAAPRPAGEERRQLALRRRRAACPGMLFASARMAPPGGRLTGFSRDAARSAAGRSACRRATTGSRWSRESWWAAEHALNAARSALHRAREPHADDRAAVRAGARRRRCAAAVQRGDYDAAVEGSRPLAATYCVAPTPHLALEPLARPRASAATGSRSGRRPRRRTLRAPRRPRRRASASASDALSDAGRRAGGPRARSRRDRRSRSSWRAQLRRPVQLTLVAKRRARTTIALAPADAGADDRAARRRRDHRRVEHAGRRRRRARRGARAPRRQASADALGIAALDGAVPPYAIPDVRIEAVDGRPAASHRLHARLAAARVDLLHRKLHRRAGARARGSSRWRSGWRCSAAIRGSRAACSRGARSADGTAAGAGSTHGHRRLLGVRIAHRPGRRGEHRRRPADQGRPAGRGGRLRADRQSGAGAPADRRRADLGAGAGDRRRARMGRRHAARAAARRDRPAAHRATRPRSRSS